MNDAIRGDDSQEAGGDGPGSAAAGRAGLLAQLRQLEDFAARTVSEGDAPPPEATEMILHLRQIVEALDGLASSMADPPAGADAVPRQVGQQDDVEGAVT
jgi:hypothetical protein